MAHVPSDARTPHGSPRSVLRRPLLTLGAVVLATAGLGSLGAAVVAASPAGASGADPAPLITAAVAVADADAPTPQAPRVPRATPTAAAARVAVVGDSLIFTTASEQEATLAARGYDASAQGNPGKALSDPWIQARLDETRDDDIVVLATASNDNVQVADRAGEVGLQQAGAEYADRLDDTLDRVSAPCTVVVDVRTRSSALYHPETAATTNAQLRSVAARHRVVVVSWSELSAAHDQHDWFVGDELHFVNGDQRRDAGVAAYTQAVADGVDDCAALLAGR